MREAKVDRDCVEKLNGILIFDLDKLEFIHWFWEHCSPINVSFGKKIGKSRYEFILTPKSNLLSSPQSKDGILAFIMSSVNLKKSFCHCPSVVSHARLDWAFILQSNGK